MSISKSNILVSYITCFSALCWTEDYQLTIVLPLQLLFNYCLQLITISSQHWPQNWELQPRPGNMVILSLIVNSCQRLRIKSTEKTCCSQSQTIVLSTYIRHSKLYNFFAGRQFQSVSKWTLACSRQTSCAQSGSTSGNLSRWQTVWWQTIWK